MDSSLIAVLTGSGGAAAALGGVLVCFIMGLLYPKSVVDDLRTERDLLKESVKNERERGDAAVAAAQGAHDIMAALQTGVQLARGVPAALPAEELKSYPELGKPGSL